MPFDAMLQQAVDASGEVILLTDRQGMLTFVNRAFERLYGYTASEVVGKATPRILKSDRTDPAVYTALWEQLNRGEIVRTSFTNRTRDGRLIDVDATINAVHDEAGDIVGFVAVQRDVTQEHLATAALARNEARYRTLAEAAHDAIFILNAEQRFVYVNRAALDSAGATLSDMIGHTVVECFPPGTGPELERDIEGVRKTGVATYTEKAIQFPRGIRWVSTWLVPIPSAVGQPCDVMGISRDMTDRHEMAAALERQHHFLDAVIQASPVGIILVNESGWTCEMANAAVRAFAGDDLVPGARLADVWPSVAAQLVPLLERTMGSTTPQNLDIELQPAEGTRTGQATRRAVVTASRLQLPYHTGAAVLVMLTDVTERRQLEEQLLQAQKMEAIGRLAGGIAHDFNNLLTPILGYSELVMATLAQEDSRHEDLEEVCRAAHSASELTRRLLTFSRKQITEPVVLDLNQVLADVEKIVRRAIGEDVEVIMTCAADLGHIRGDRTQVEQIVMNLSVNARDAMPKGGTLTITTADKTLSDHEAGARRPIPPGQYVVLSVTDTGTGMTPDVQSHLFEPFFTTKEFGKGTGLGLSTVYGIMSQSGGYIAVRSTPGEGTTFLMYFPRVDAAVTPASRSDADLPEPFCRGDETILIVEDNAGLKRLAQRVLKDCGYTTLVAENAADALRVARALRAPLHLLLTDMVMPKTDGLTLARQITAERPDTRVLLMSGYSGDDIVRRGTLPAGVRLLQKPFTRGALTRTVREVLDAPVAPPIDSTVETPR